MHLVGNLILFVALIHTTAAAVAAVAAVAAAVGVICIMIGIRIRCGPRKCSGDRSKGLRFDL